MSGRRGIKAQAADARCRSAAPPDIELGEGHEAACWRVAKEASPAA